MLDPGNVNTGAVHQELASTTTHPPNFFSPQSLENGSEINLQQEVRLKKKTFTSIYATFILHTLGTLYHRFVLIFDFTHARL